MSTTPSSIVVAGDACIDWFATPVRRAVSVSNAQTSQMANWQLRDGLQMFPWPGGAWLLADLVEKATGQSVIRQEVPLPLEHQGCECALHSMIELKPFPLSRTEKDLKDLKSHVWRVDRFRGFAGPTSGESQKCQMPIKDDGEAASLIVLDDVGNGFRESAGVWPKALQHAREDSLILWKLARPLNEGALGKHLLGQHTLRTIIVLDVDDLRAEGAAISRQLSWERTTGDLIRALTHDQHFAALREAAHLVVRLDLEGAVHLSKLGSDPSAVELTYLPSGIEGSTRAEIPGEMLGFTSIFVAALAGELAKSGGTSITERIRIGVQTGLAATRRLFVQGFGPASAQPTKVTLSPITGKVTDFVTVNVAPMAGRHTASRLIDYVRKVPLESIAGKIVQHGIRPAIPDAPVARFGGLTTLDRSEIETFRSIRNLISEYLAQPSPERPLSIAVFGPPGSGKSFGVAQVAKSIGDVEKIEFNVSQFERAEQLTAAFHVVRDTVVRGRVPLVFFDEFDSGQSLNWLKHFLAPMQDGKFLDGESVHLIGRAIFVFAGGTKHTFADFAQLTEEDFRKAKGPDFISRLRGFVDVRGTDRREPNDTMHVIRRAVLLRSLLERKVPALLDSAGILRLDAGVLRAFLRCRSFRHGARSMEAIIEMSQLAGHEAFERSCLPSVQQLDLHVDAEEFMESVTQDVRFAENREILAKAIHQRFVEQWTGKKSADDPSMQPWAVLPRNYQNDNLAQADDIVRKLGLINCAFAPAKTGDPSGTLSFTPQEIEIMAEAEHERWNDSKRLQGYAYAPGKKSDNDPKTHSCLLPWCDLSEDEKDKDRDTVKAIPEFMEAVGFRVFRLS